jgi:preprotein translocase subunit SecG
MNIQLFLYLYGADIVSAVFLVIIIIVGVLSRKKRQRYVR